MCHNSELIYLDVVRVCSMNAGKVAIVAVSSRLNFIHHFEVVKISYYKKLGKVSFSGTYLQKLVASKLSENYLAKRGGV